MPNTRSAKKALRQSNKKKAQNSFWMKRIKEVLKEVKKQLSTEDSDVAIIKSEESKFYKVVDKAAKNNAIHKNKARRLKSRISKKIAAHENSGKTQKESKKKTGKGSKSSK